MLHRVSVRIKMPNNNSKLVYSTEYGKMCSECAKPKKECICHELKKEKVSNSDGVVRLKLDTKNRKGKGVTLIEGLPMNEQELLKLAKVLKQKFGVGGSVKNYGIELQGDHREQIKLELEKQNFNVKLI